MLDYVGWKVDDGVLAMDHRLSTMYIGRRLFYDGLLMIVDWGQMIRTLLRQMMIDA